MRETKVACQLIVFGERARSDLRGVLRAVADAGYDGIEAGPRGGKEENDELRRLLDETGLALAGAHTSYWKLDRIEESLNFCVEFGAAFLMVSGTGDRSAGAKSYADAAKVLNERGRRAAERGVTICYHNHSWEFKERFAAGSGMDILLEALDPSEVRLCVDTYWVDDGSEDPAAFVAKWRDRIAILHLKDRKNDTFAEVGHGELDFPAIFKALQPSRLPWVVIEQDRTDRAPEESVRMSRDYLRERLGA